MNQIAPSDDNCNDSDRLLAPAANVNELPEVTAGGTSTGNVRTSQRCRCRMPPFFVEPVLILYFFSEFPVDIIAQKYILDWIAEAVRHNEGINRSSLDIASSSSCSGNGSAADVAFQDHVQSIASWFGVIESLIWGIPAVITTVLLGSGSDRLGRRFAILPSLFGVLASCSTAFFVVWFKAPIFWLFIGDFLYGCCGSFAAMTMSCFAYVADRTPPERRMIRIVIVEMCMLLAGVVSPIGVGFVIDRIGYAYTLLIIVGSSAFNLIYVFIFLPDTTHDKLLQSPSIASSPDGCLGSNASGDESIVVGGGGDGVQDDGFDDINTSEVNHRVGLLSADYNNHPDLGNAPTDEDALLASVNRAPNDTESANHARCRSDGNRLVNIMCADIRRSTLQLLGPGPRRWKVIVLLSAFFISNLPAFNVSVGTLFEMNHPLCWNIQQVGLYSGVSLGISTMGALITAPLMKMCLPDIAIALWAGLTSVATNIYKSFVRNSLMMFISPSLSMFSILMIPSIRSMLSGIVNDDEQGAVFGAIASVEVLCFMVGTIIFNAVYSSTLFISSGFVFIVMAMFYAVGDLLLMFYAIKTNCGGWLKTPRGTTATVEVAD